MSGFEVNAADITSYSNQVLRASREAQSLHQPSRHALQVGLATAGPLYGGHERFNGSVYKTTRLTAQRLVTIRQSAPTPHTPKLSVCIQ
jgi:hypothetical protein